MSDIVQDIIEAARKISLAKPFEHPQYIEGTLYLTRKQISALLNGLNAPLDYYPKPGAVWGIPVVAVKECELITLPSGKTLMYRYGTFYIFKPNSVMSWHNV